MKPSVQRKTLTKNEYTGTIQNQQNTKKTYPSTDKWQIYIMKYCEVIKSNGVCMVYTTLMNLTNKLLTEINQTLNAKCLWFHSYQIPRMASHRDRKYIGGDWQGEKEPEVTASRLWDFLWCEKNVFHLESILERINWTFNDCFYMMWVSL